MMTRLFDFCLGRIQPISVVYALLRVHRSTGLAKVERGTASAGRLAQPKMRHPLRVHRAVDVRTAKGVLVKDKVLRRRRLALRPGL